MQCSYYAELTARRQFSHLYTGCSVKEKRAGTFIPAP
jgi:hypothetical protein